MWHPDEGTIHAWLDGALPDEQARALEEHIAGCAPCAAGVAEARGMIAGASRVLASLDDAPAGVMPPRTGVGRPPVRRTSWFRRPGVGIAAAMAIVATGTTWAVTRGWDEGVPAVSEQSASVVIRAQDSAVRESIDAVPQGAAITAPMESAANEAADAGRPAPAQGSVGGVATNRKAAPQRALDSSADAPAPPPSPPLSLAQPLADSRERAEAESGERLSAGAREAIEIDTVATIRAEATDAVALSELRRAVAASAPSAPRQRTRAADQAPVISGRSLTETARAVAGCYALELGQSYDGTRPDLPSVVRLAESTTEAAGASMAPPPPAQGFRLSPSPLLVPPALDSGQLGWRMARSDSVSMLIAGEGRALQVTFPAVMDRPQLGTVTSGAMTGVASWSAPVLVQRVPCGVR